MFRKKHNELLLFLHIPKAGGTTLNTILDKQFPGGQQYALRDGAVERAANELNSLSFWKWNRLRLVRGHLSYGLHERLNASCTYFTFLREPVDRVISHYYFARNTPVHYLYKELNRSGASLEEYVKGQWTIETDNWQCRQVSGMSDPKKYPFGSGNRQMLDLAKKHLEEFCFVGILERFDEGLKLMADKLGWKIGEYHKENVSATRVKKEQVPEHVKASVMECNSLDAELYDFAVKLFENALRKQGSNLAA